MNERGFCYYATFEFIHRLESEEDIRPHLQTLAALAEGDTLGIDEIFLVNGERLKNGEPFGHAWIEFRDFVYDATVDTDSIAPLDQHYIEYDWESFERFTRDQVFQLLQHPEVGTTWAKLPTDQADRIFSSTLPSTYEGKERDFHQEFLLGAPDHSSHQE